MQSSPVSPGGTSRSSASSTQAVALRSGLPMVTGSSAKTRVRVTVTVHSVGP